MGPIIQIHSSSLILLNPKGLRFQNLADLASSSRFVFYSPHCLGGRLIPSSAPTRRAIRPAEKSAAPGGTLMDFGAPHEKSTSPKMSTLQRKRTSQQGWKWNVSPCVNHDALNDFALMCCMFKTFKPHECVGPIEGSFPTSPARP